SAQTSAPVESDGLRMAVGSAAVRMASPSGGLLSDGEAAPPAARDFSASVNKEWDEPSLALPAPRERAAIEPTALTAREIASDALVVMPGPSGFPLVGAVAIGHRRGNPTGTEADFTRSPVLAHHLPDSATGSGPEFLVANQELQVAARYDDAGQSRTLAVNG